MTMASTAKTYWLLGPDRRPYASATPGELGGNRSTRVYGRLDCPGALRRLARGYPPKNRVFFADVPAALAAGYRPCAVCLPAEYAAWTAATGGAGRPRGRAGSRASA